MAEDKAVKFISAELSYPKEVAIGFRQNYSSMSNQRIPSTGGIQETNSSTTTFNVSIPSDFCSADVVYECDLRIELTTTAVVAVVHTAPKVADLVSATISSGLRPYVLNRNLVSGTCDINGLQYSTTPSLFVDYLLNQESQEVSRLNSPSGLGLADNRVLYNPSSEMSNVYRQGKDTPSGMISRGYGNNYRSQLLVGANSQAGATTTSNLRIFGLRERLFLSPFNYTRPTGQALYDVQKMDVVLTFSMSALNNWLSANSDVVSAGGQTAGNFTVTNIYRENEYLNLKTFRPTSDFKLERLLPFDVPRIQVFTETKTNAINAMTAGGAGPPTTLASISTGALSQSSAYKFSSMPSKIGICVYRNDPSQIGLTQPTTLLPITNVNIQINGHVGQLSNFGVEELYKMSVKNGYNRLFREFSGSFSDELEATTAYNGSNAFCGCMVYVRPSDMALLPTEVGNSRHDCQFDCAITIANVSNVAVSGANPVYLRMFFEFDDIMEYDMSRHEYRSRTGTLPISTILDNDKVLMKEDEMDILVGGGWWSDRWDDLKSIGKSVLKPVSHFIRPVITQTTKNLLPGWSHGAIDLVDRVAEKAGYGYEKPKRKPRKKGGVSANVMKVGGNILSRDELRQAMSE